jgi:hypothetical protein
MFTPVKKQSGWGTVTLTRYTFRTAEQAALTIEIVRQIFHAAIILQRNWHDRRRMSLLLGKFA